MKAGTNNEDWRSLPAVQIDVQPTNALLNFIDLAELTRLSVVDEKLARTLLQFVYIGVLQKVRGLQVPAVQVDPLVMIARTLKGAAPR